MDFDFSDEQEQLRDAVRKWVDKGYSFERRQATEKAGGFDRATWNELANLGLCGLYVPEEDGGLGMGPIEGMVVMEELGRGIVLAPLNQALIAGAVIANYANPRTKSDWLPRMSSGDALVVLAYQEQGTRYALSCGKALAVAAGNAYQVTGHKSIVPVGDQADAFLVPALLGEKAALFLVERAQSGVVCRGYGTQDGSRAAEVQLQHAVATLVSADGQTALEHAVDIGIAALCAEAVGVMEKVLAITAQYMMTRKQFGTAIGSFQALRHRVADMKMQVELARSMGFYASLKLTAPTAERRAAMARAKYQLGTAMRFVGQQAVQLHGGIGVTNEYIVSHYFKRLTQMEMTFGDSQHHLGEVSRRMEDKAGVFA